MLLLRRTVQNNRIQTLAGGIRRFSDKDEHTKSEGAKKSERSAADKTSSAERLHKLLKDLNKGDDVHVVYKVAKPQKKKKVPKVLTKPQSADHKEQLVEAAKEVSKVIPGDAKQTQSELLLKLQQYAGGDVTRTIEDLISGIKVDKTKERAPSIFQGKPSTTDVYYKTDGKTSRTERQQQPISVNLFSNESLNIFSKSDEFIEPPFKLKTWEALEKRELELLVTHPPSNYFEKMARWTKEGKLWRFPIDNEQGLDEEAKVDFSDHVFVDQHLEPWCPKKGPIRHFMELVCVGLSKNPYITANDKKEHIMWFKKYFEEKQQIIEAAIDFKGQSVSAKP